MEAILQVVAQFLAVLPETIASVTGAIVLIKSEGRRVELKLKDAQTRRSYKSLEWWASTVTGLTLAIGGFLKAAADVL